jgi:hypothetical protein
MSPLPALGNKETIEALSITVRQGFLFFGMEKNPWLLKL